MYKTNIPPLVSSSRNETNDIHHQELQYESMDTGLSSYGHRKQRLTKFSSIYKSLFAITILIAVFGIYSSFMRLRLQHDYLITKENVQNKEGTSKWLQLKTVDGELVTAATGMPLNLNTTRNISRVVYNRVGKCGSRTLMAISEKMSVLNGFRHVKSQEYHGRRLSREEEADFVYEVMAIPPPFLYNRHLDFVRFPPHFAKIAPAYINLIRDPVERKISSYYYMRFGDESQSRDGSKRNASITFEECVIQTLDECKPGKMTLIPFFCGQSEMCHEESEWALETAKRNVVENYVFVGLLEHLHRSLRIWQYLMPAFFRSAPQAYDNILREEGTTKFKSLSRVEPPESVKEIMRKRMRLDYEFYNFIKERMVLIEEQFNLPTRKHKKKKKKNMS
ncbi:uronyl 2-sulfotransferase-like [Glandiceps talaboti]